MKDQVLWLPALPAEGWVSMDRYWRELEREFARIQPENYAVVCPLGKAPGETRNAPRLRRAWQKYVTYPRLAGRQEHSAVVHVLDHSYAHLLRHVPASSFKIVTLQDQLNPLDDPGKLNRSQIRRYRRVVECLRAADLLIATSRISAHDVARKLDIDVAGIEVCPLGVDISSFTTKPPVNLPELRGLGACKKILSVGSALPRKNLGILPETFRLVKEKVGDVALIRVGELLPGEIRQRLLDVLPQEHLVELGPRFGAEVSAAYWDADALFFPSYLEGFGLPVLEAMAAGCPVACSDASSIPEVGGDAVLYFDYRDPAQAAEQLVRIFNEAPLREKMVAAGRIRAATMSWEHHARFLAERYERAIAGRSGSR